MSQTQLLDPLGYFEKLKGAGFSEEQARVQADAMRQQNEILRQSLERQEEKSRQESSTKGDLRETELLLKKEIREVELRLQKEIREVDLKLKDVEIRLLKWQWAIGIALAAIMAKGFNWLGF